MRNPFANAAETHWQPSASSLAIVATSAEVSELLAGTSIPAGLVGTLLEGASPLWLLGQAPEQVAGDLALCHPALLPGEVRAIAHPLEDRLAGARPGRGSGSHKVSMVAPDRPGLMAGAAGALAAHGLSIVAAAASSWPELGVAVQRVVVEAAVVGSHVGWDAVGADLTASLTGRARLVVPFVPCPPVTVSCTDHGGDRVVVAVRAPDRVGLLWAIASWFEEHACNIEVANVDAEDGMAIDTFVVHGSLDADALAIHLAGRTTPSLPWPVTAGLSAGLALGRGTARVAAAPLRAARRRQGR